MTNGYEFYFDTAYGLLAFPITPNELSIKVGTNSSTVTLISEGDINILKSPSLVEVEFEARFPMRKYPYSKTPLPFQDYVSIWNKLITNKKSFRFIVARSTSAGSRTWDTNMLMALESYEIAESVEEGDDVLVSFKLKQYKEYGVKFLKTGSSSSSSGSSGGSSSTSTSTSATSRDTSTSKASSSRTYTVKSGDNLYNIAKRYYGSGAKRTIIYKANKEAIEADAKRRGKKSSSNGWWIFPGLVLIIPEEGVG